MFEELLEKRLENILIHSETIEKRINKIPAASDFNSKKGEMVFDAILMRLQALGESIKKIESRHPGFIHAHLSDDADKIIRFRDIISHHYEKLDKEIVHKICSVNVPHLRKTVAQLLKTGLKKENSTSDQLLPKKAFKKTNKKKL